MDKLISKLNYKGDKRICILHGKKTFIKAISKPIKETRIDTEIDPKFLYNFIIVFAESSKDVDNTFLAAVHNLYEDGIIWYLYPKNSPCDSENELSRKKGWNSCKEAGFDAVRHICVDDELSATRFRNKKFIKRRSKD